MDMMQRSLVWCDMADEARKVASRLHDPELRRQLLIIAAGYEALGQRTQTLARDLTPANANERPAADRDA